MKGGSKPRNFGVLKHLVALGAQAELLFTIDAVACLMRLRLLGERLTRELAAHAGLQLTVDEKQSAPGCGQALSWAAHGGQPRGSRWRGTRSDALHQLKMCRRKGSPLSKLPPSFKVGAFIPPAAPQDASAELAEELDWRSVWSLDDE